MRIVLSLVTVVALSAPLSAQRVTLIDLSQFGWGVIAHPVSVNTDGNPATQEWLIGPMFSRDRRVVAVQPDGRVCVGVWMVIPSEAVMQTLHGRTVFTRIAWPNMEIIELHHPAC